MLGWRRSVQRWALVGIVVGLGIAVVSAGAAIERPAGLTTSLRAGAALRTCTVGLHAVFPAYDPVNHYLYVSNQFAGNISVVKSVCTVFATIPLPSRSQPLGGAFDPVNNLVYVTDYALDRVYAISGTTIVQTINSSTFRCPQAPMFDPAGGVIVVPNSCGSTISLINATGSVTGTVPVGSGPISIGYDPHTSTLLVANSGSDTVTVLGAANFTVLANTGVGTEPIAVAFDPVDELDYVTSGTGSNVTALNGWGGSHASIALKKPGTSGTQDIGWDQSQLAIYVADYANNVSVIQGLAVAQSIKLPVGTAPGGIEYDPFNGELYVTSLSGDVLYAIG